MYNSRDTVERCILSAIRTGYPDLEIIVVDDGSSDGSPQIVSELMRRYPGIIRYINQGRNYGPTRARNTGAKDAKGDYLFFLDCDTEVLPDLFKRFSDRIKNADAVTGIYHYDPLNKGLVHRYKALFNYYFFSKRGVIEYEVFDASRAGIRSAVFRDLGGFNEDLAWGMDYENEEFGYRLSGKYKNILDPSIMVRHNFPGFLKLTKTYFRRVMIWAELFLKRRQFESGGVTSMGTGCSTAALLLVWISLPLMIINKYLACLPLSSFLIYLYGYGGFFLFVARKKPLLLPAAFILNLYFTTVIGMAAFIGLVKALAGRGRICVI
jgi:glycosyltransferase involved in cell wall biosynthesis